MIDVRIREQSRPCMWAPVGAKREGRSLIIFARAERADPDDRNGNLTKQDIARPIATDEKRDVTAFSFRHRLATVTALCLLAGIARASRLRFAGCRIAKSGGSSAQCEHRGGLRAGSHHVRHSSFRIWIGKGQISHYSVISNRHLHGMNPEYGTKPERSRRYSTWKPKLDCNA